MSLVDDWYGPAQNNFLDAVQRAREVHKSQQEVGGATTPVQVHVDLSDAMEFIERERARIEEETRRRVEAVDALAQANEEAAALLGVRDELQRRVAEEMERGDVAIRSLTEAFRAEREAAKRRVAELEAALQEAASRYHEAMEHSSQGASWKGCVQTFSCAKWRAALSPSTSED